METMIVQGTGAQDCSESELDLKSMAVKLAYKLPLLPTSPFLELISDSSKLQTHPNDALSLVIE